MDKVNEVVEEVAREWDLPLGAQGKGWIHLGRHLDASTNRLRRR